LIRLRFGVMSSRYASFSPRSVDSAMSNDLRRSCDDAVDEVVVDAALGLGDVDLFVADVRAGPIHDQPGRIPSIVLPSEYRRITRTGLAATSVPLATIGSRKSDDYRRLGERRTEAS